VRKGGFERGKVFQEGKGRLSLHAVDKIGRKKVTSGPEGVYRVTPIVGMHLQ